MLLPEDFPAKTSHLPAKKKELSTEKEAAYGGICLDLLATFDPNTCSLKMSQGWLLEMMEDGSQSSCQTWPPSGLMLNGTVYRLPTLGGGMKGKEYGLLPTPVKSDGSEPSLKQFLRKEETWEDNSSLTATFRGLFHGLKGKQKVSGVYVVNPCVTEMMMGYPIGWTELPAAETH